MSEIQNNILQKACIERINQVFDTCEQYFNRRFFRPKIDFSLRGRTAGRAFHFQNLIKLNAKILVENGDKFIADTPGHEAAHIIARYVFGNCIRPHGNEWAKVMAVINQPATRCHNFEVKTKNVYICNCPERKHYVSTRMHNNVLRGTHNVSCILCSGKLTWINLAE